MTDKNLFTEKQRFTQWWLWLILLGINSLFLFGVFKQIIMGEPFGDKPAGDTELLIISGAMIAFTLAFLSIRLETEIASDGIYVRFFPFHLRFRHYTWDSLTKSYIRKYSSIAEYGGWGIRFGFPGKGKAYNVSGKNGLQLVFRNGKKLLIGTKKADEIEAVLKQLGQYKP